jgi:ethanolaminephosphotransferase
MPSRLAPNVITLLGISAIYFNIICLLIYTPDLVGPGPGWIYISFAAGLWFYQTMDNIDGKQARKTDSSSPLGELFDHGIDSLNCCLGGLVQSACMGLGSGGDSAFTTFSTCLAMYFSTWETYHTHVLYLGYMNGPTEGIVVAVLVMIITGIVGPEIWQQKVADVFPDLFITRLFGDYLLKEVWIMAIFLSIVFCHIPFW